MLGNGCIRGLHLTGFLRNGGIIIYMTEWKMLVILTNGYGEIRCNSGTLLYRIVCSILEAASVYNNKYTKEPFTAPARSLRHCSWSLGVGFFEEFQYRAPRRAKNWVAHTVEDSGFGKRCGYTSQA